MYCLEVPYFVGENVINEDSNDDPGIILLFLCNGCNHYQ